MDDRTLIHRLIDGLPGWIARLCAWGCGLVILTWLAGRVLNDRYDWSQWLWWIPGPVPVVAVIVGLMLARVRRISDKPTTRRRRTIAWGTAAAAMLVWFGVIEHRFLHRANADPRGLKIVHWNVAQPADRIQRPGEMLVGELVKLNGDVTVLTFPALVAWDKTLNERLGNGQGPTWVGPMVVITRLPIVQTRQVVAVEGSYIELLVLDARESLGRNLVIYMADLVSDPLVPRAEQARRIRRFLDDANVPPPDIVIGDLNVPRGSWSLECAFPGMKHAFDIAGHGYGASFDRQLPLYHIDHTLLGSNLTATRYDLVDCGASRHYAQACWVQTAVIND